MFEHAVLCVCVREGGGVRGGAEAEKGSGGVQGIVEEETQRRKLKMKYSKRVKIDQSVNQLVDETQARFTKIHFHKHYLRAHVSYFFFLFFFLFLFGGKRKGKGGAGEGEGSLTISKAKANLFGNVFPSEPKLVVDLFLLPSSCRGLRRPQEPRSGILENPLACARAWSDCDNGNENDDDELFEDFFEIAID